MELTFVNRTSQKQEQQERDIRRIARAAETRLQLPEDLEVSVLFVRSRTIHQINRDYRGIDRPTDVITFAARDEMDKDALPEEQKELGDIFINIDYARRQAREYGHSYEREVGFLFTHGLLHTLGYDHMQEKDARVMFALQDEILDPILPRQ